MKMSIRSLALVVCATIVHAATTPAQSIRVADSLLEQGRLARAESLYYAAARAHPSDPAVRKALGDYLIARGAARVGSTLLEEAIKFGGDRSAIERDLGVVYLMLGDYHLLAALTASPAADRERAKWLIAYETRTIAPDSMVAVPFRASSDAGVIGRVQIRVNGRALDAVVTTDVRGISISEPAAAPLRLHVFPGPGSGVKNAGVLAVADSISIGALSMRNVPVTIVRLEKNEPAAIGLDMLGRFAPTFDPRAARLVLRVGGSIPTTPGDTLATLLRAPELDVLQPEGWVPISQPSVATMLRDRRWTFDAKRGRIIVER